MEDLIALEGLAETGEHVFFMTYGRIQDAIDPAEVEALVMAKSGGFAIPSKLTSIHVCDSLQAASHAPGFYESFFGFCNQSIPFGKKYRRWRANIAKRMNQGYEIAYLGAVKSPVG